MGRGGARVGAGKKLGSGMYGEPTKPMKIPQSMVGDVLNYIKLKGYKIPLYSSKVQAGFPSPADDHVESRLDFNEYLIKRPAATFIVRATGQSMINAGIDENDLLVVDKSLDATEGRIVIAAVDGNLTVKRIRFIRGKVYLYPENDKFAPVEIIDDNITIWGVVTSIIKTC